MEPLPRRTETPALHARAMDNLHFIRRTIESAGAFTAVPGKGGVAMGCVGLAAWLAATRPVLAEQWLTIWLVAGAVAAVLGGIAMFRKARSRGERLLGLVGRRFLLGLTPPILAAAILTPLLLDAVPPSGVAGMWLLLYGAGVLAGGAFSVRPVPILGALFMTLGVLCLVSGPGLENVYLGLGFGGLHLVFGFLIARRYGG